MNRRDFVRALGVGAAAALLPCKPSEQSGGWVALISDNHMGRVAGSSHNCRFDYSRYVYLRFTSRCEVFRTRRDGTWERVQ